MMMMAANFGRFIVAVLQLPKEPRDAAVAFAGKTGSMFCSAFFFRRVLFQTWWSSCRVLACRPSSNTPVLLKVFNAFRSPRSISSIFE
jgi:hypothetical protein